MNKTSDGMSIELKTVRGHSGHTEHFYKLKQLQMRFSGMKQCRELIQAETYSLVYINYKSLLD